MASNLRVDTILPSSGLTLGIGTANGTINFLGNSNLTTSGDVTIGGDLGVGGTVTYEDVARIDATGLSTFREGYKVGPLTGIALTAYKDGSIRTTGIITASSFVGSLAASNLTGALPSISAANITSIPGANITGTIPAAALSNVDLVGLRKDIAILALQVAVDTNRAAYNLTDSFIEQFEDDTGLATQTNCDRTGSEYMTSVNPNVVNIDAGIAGGNNMLGDGDQTEAASYTGYDGVTRSKGKMVEGFQTYEGFNLKHIFAAGEDFELIIAMRGDYQNVGYLHGSGITALSQVDYKSNNGYWSGSPSDTFDSYPGNHYGQYHAPVANDGSGDYRNLYRFSRTSNTFKLQYYGRSTNDITVNATTIAAVRASTNYVSNIGSPGTKADKMILGFGEAGDNANRYFFIEVANTGTHSTSATATLISTSQTASSARTKVSGVFLYKNNAGTATLGTDLKLYVTCNGGTNWTEVTSSDMTTSSSNFSTGVKTVYFAEKTCTSGTSIKYKVEWANQADGSKDTQLHGMALNY